MSLLLNTETTHNSYAACGRKDNTKTAQKHKAQWHLTTLARKGNRDFALMIFIWYKNGILRHQTSHTSTVFTLYKKKYKYRTDVYTYNDQWYSRSNYDRSIEVLRPCRMATVEKISFFITVKAIGRTLRILFSRTIPNDSPPLETKMCP
jgi:hypothetical protein